MFEMECYDEDGYIITSLTQWDTNRRIIIRMNGDTSFLTSAPYVHFYNKRSKNAYTMESELVSIGTGFDLLVTIPNILLTENSPITVCVRVSEGNPVQGYVISSSLLFVNEMPKPDGFEYIDNVNILDLDGFIEVLKNEVAESTTLPIATMQNLDKNVLAGKVWTTTTTGAEFKDIVANNIPLGNSNVQSWAESVVTLLIDVKSALEENKIYDAINLLDSFILDSGTLR